MKLLKAIAAVVSISHGMIGCQDPNILTPQGQSEALASDAMRGPPGEPTFNSVMNLQISLPMKEADFLQELRKLGVSMSKLGPGGFLPRIPRPKLNSQLRLDEIDHAWLVDGGYDATRGVRRYFVCYVRRSGDVIYIENDYAFQPPS